ncbi:hypothetical protein MGN01_34500 [Methylobacterium gnaphalii]|uniref:Right handed beta helix domain-containing protein n=2 Tax=Methylobacterium gnaphalii TaxID=1010610 RepID=A0A512JNR8_9HYPH|nr:hypothetical protein MGN01_34500 [Methylobacterium gnaphalii]GLS49132.1 hypothetical protein GCM10007885_19800 [Methylobacterium gnaphalii]
MMLRIEAMPSASWRAVSCLVPILFAVAPIYSLAQNGEPNAPPCPATAVRVPAGESIQAAALRAGPGGAVCIGAGLHRMQQVAPLPGQTFVGEPGSILNGAQILGPFARTGPFWATSVMLPLRPRTGECRKGSLCSPLPWLFLDGRPLRRVLSRAELGPGRFLLEPALGRLLIADDPTGRQVEASVVATAFQSLSPDVRISGVIVEKYDSPPQIGAIRGDRATGWHVERTEIRFNAGLGVAVGTNGIVRDNIIHHNGQLGAAAHGHQIRFENNRIFENNTAGFDPGWEAGGIKITEAQFVTVRGNHVYRNDGPGIWCDINCRDAVIEDNIVEANQGAGIFYEISFSAVVRRNKVRFNGANDAPWYWDADIQIAGSQGVEVTDNVIDVRPGGHAIMLIDQGRAKLGGGLYRTTGNRVHGNRIVFSGDGDAGGVTDTDRLSPNGSVIEAGNNSFDGNTYLAPATVSPSFVWGRDPLTFTAFRQLGQERAGSVKLGAEVQ